MIRPLVSLAASLAMLFGAPASARESLGIFGQWGAFRDADGGRCYAITAARGSTAGSVAFASVGTWPRRNVRGQLHIRLSRPLAPEGTATLRIGRERFALAGQGHDLWVADPGAEASVLATMRSARAMSVSGRDGQGRRFTESYALDGVATALDAASIACARPAPR